MSGDNILVDTNILIYLLNGEKRIAEILQDKNVFCSFITEIELKSSKKYSLAEEKQIEHVISSLHVLDINQQIKDNTVLLRKKYGLKIPDALISATAIFLEFPLLTADKAFTKVTETDVYFYNINS